MVGAYMLAFPSLPDIWSLSASLARAPRPQCILIVFIQSRIAVKNSRMQPDDPSEKF